MTTHIENITPRKKKSGLKIFAIIIITVIISIIATIFILDRYIFPKKFDSVELNQREESVLNQKLKQFGLPTLSASSSSDDNALKPEAYSEKGAKREVSFSEKELNALLAKNTDLSDKVAIDLSNELASVKIIIPLDPDFPFLGGKTLKITAGAELAYKNARPIVILKGVSAWGVPIPNAWLGNLKNVDLVKEFGGDEGFWKSFANGIENIHVGEGRLIIKLKE